MHEVEQSSRRAHWDIVYATKPVEQVSWFQGHPAPSLRMIDACRLPQNAHIIDIGGGASLLVDAMLDRGYTSISVLDIAAAPLEAARTRLGPDRAARINWIVADVTTWQPPVAHFDLWHDRAVFHFLTQPTDRAAYVAALTRGVKPAGHVIIATFAPDGPPTCSNLPVQRYDSESLATELGPHFNLIETTRDQHMTPWGKPQQFQFSRFQRA